MIVGQEQKPRLSSLSMWVVGSPPKWHFEFGSTTPVVGLLVVSTKISWTPEKHSKNYYYYF